jgi:glutathione S-transferase
MPKLYHFPLCPFSRKLRIVLAEKHIAYEAVIENFWEKRPSFAFINPAMQVPVLVDNELALADSYAITEYLEEKYPDASFTLLGKTPEERAETRRLISWFDQKFFYEVTRYILNEKVIRYYTGIGQPLSDALRAAKVNIIPHLEYITFLTRDKKWLTGDHFTLADITAAAHLSVLDYLNEITWSACPEVKEWYALIKSRPSFRGLLTDRTPGFHPPKCYANLDF